MSGRLAPLEPALAGIPCHYGLVSGLEDVAPPASLRHFDCRNNRLAELALLTDGFAEDVARAVSRHGAHRVGVFLGTSTSGTAATEAAYLERGEGAALPPFNLHGTHGLGGWPSTSPNDSGLVVRLTRSPPRAVPAPRCSPRLSAISPPDSVTPPWSAVWTASV